MNKRKASYYFLIISIIIFCISISTILKNLFSKENFFSVNTKKNSYSEIIMERSIQTKNKNFLQMIENISWNKRTNDIMLFSSRRYFSKNNILHDLYEEEKEILPPIKNEWLIKNNLDYSNPNILNEDSDGDGFTNLEEWKGNDPYKNPGKESSNPNDPYSHPLLWTKLRCNKASICKTNYYLDFVGVMQENGEDFFKIQPQTLIPTIDEQGKKVFSIKIIRVKLGEKLSGLPLVIQSYERKKILYRGIWYDTSELMIKNILDNELFTLIKKSTLYPQSTLVTISEGIIFEYPIVSVTKKIFVSYNDSFELEPLFLKEKAKKNYQPEAYKLIKINNQEVTIERNGNYYSIPFLD